MDNHLFRRILVAADGSEYSNKALRYTLDIAKKYGSRVTLLHVVFQPVYAYGIEGVGIVESDERLRGEGRRILEAGQSQARNEGLELETKLLEGHPAEVIAREANEGSYDLVVIGSRGLGRVKAFLLGSISDKVSHYCKCHIFIVKP